MGSGWYYYSCIWVEGADRPMPQCRYNLMNTDNKWIVSRDEETTTSYSEKYWLIKSSQSLQLEITCRTANELRFKVIIYMCLLRWLMCTYLRNKSKSDIAVVNCKKKRQMRWQYLYYPVATAANTQKQKNDSTIIISAP